MDRVNDAGMCDCDVIKSAVDRERARIVEKARTDARNIMEAARSAARYEAWETAATLRIKATALRDHAFLVEEAAEL
jgi:hypothetical protein